MKLLIAVFAPLLSLVCAALALHATGRHAPDGHGGTLLTFGAKQGSIDLINHASVSPSAIRFI